MPLSPSQSPVPGPWSLLGEDYQYYTDGYDSKVHDVYPGTAQWEHTSEICIGPDGQPWTAHIELETSQGGGAGGYHGIFVHRWDGTAWVQVPYSGTLNGAVSDYQSVVQMMSVGSKGGHVLNDYLQICCDGTNVYVSHMSPVGYGSPSRFRVRVWMWDGATWTNLVHNEPHPISSVIYASLACSPSDVGHPFIAVRNDVGLTYVDRWNGSSWDHVGGVSLPYGTGETIISVAEKSLVIDNAGRPHLLSAPYSVNTSRTIGTAMLMHSYNGSSWVTVPFNQTTFGISSDYRQSGNETIARPVVSPLASGYGTNGKFQVGVMLRKWTKTAFVEHLDQGTGFGLYVAEYDCDTLAWMPLNGHAKYGHVYTYNTDKTLGYKAIPNGYFRTWSMAEPDLDKGTTWLSAEQDVIVFDAAAKWRIASTWYNYPQTYTSQTFPNDFKIQTEQYYSTPAGTMKLMRVGRELYMPLRWWNIRDPHIQRWNDQQLGYNFPGSQTVYEPGADYDDGIVDNAQEGFATYDASVDPNVGGNTNNSFYMFPDNENEYLTVKYRIRVMVKGSSGNGDFSAYHNNTFLGYVRFGAADGYNIWHTYTFPFDVTATPSQNMYLRFGINGGATSILIDWFEIVPQHDLTEMRSYVYKSTIFEPGWGTPTAWRRFEGSLSGSPVTPDGFSADKVAFQSVES